MLTRDVVVAAASLLAIGALGLLARAAEPAAVDLADLPAHEGDLVRVAGTVASEPSWGGALRFVVRDATGSARVSWREASLDLHAGDGVEAEGRVVWLRGAAELHADHVRRLPAEEAPRVRLAELARDPERYVALLVRVEAFAEPGERAGQAVLRDASGAHRVEVRLAPALDAPGWVEWPGSLVYDEARTRYVFEARA